GMFFLGMVAAPLTYFRGHGILAGILWAAAVTLRLIGIARPAWLRPIYVGIMVATWPIGWVISHLALGLLYYGVITPIAVVFRVTGRDALARRLDPKATTYWEPYNPDRGIDRYLRQF